MDQTTIDFGIDLGTSNSAIAVFVDGQVEVIKNNENQEITPSAVFIQESGRTIVGRRAYERISQFGEGDAYSGFKRQMGKRRTYTFATARVDKTPEELAAVVLKELRAAAESWAGTSVAAAVITVPANFELAQNEATQRAAGLAGIAVAPLLQEPIAAGLAYGYQRSLGDGYFMVFDLGGGTLDVTLLRLSEGLLAVIDHHGDNFCGGRDWDRHLAAFIVEKLASAGFDVMFDHRSPGYGRLLALAEEAKIRLSRSESVDVVFDGRIADSAGRRVDTTITVSRAEYEKLIESEVSKTVTFTREILERQSLPASAVSRIVLVGGPTMTPLVRAAIRSELRIELDTRIDPMTVVARGAAIFASSVPLIRTESIPASAEIQLKLAYPTVTGDSEATVGIKADLDVAEGNQLEIRRADGGWNSGRLGFASRTLLVSVPLGPRTTNVFDLRGFGRTGAPVSVSPARFAITQGLAAADPPLSRTLWIVGLDRETGEETIVPIMPKGTPLPAVRQMSVRTAREVRPGEDADVLKIHVLEGEHDRPALNRHVGFVELTGRSVSRLVPVGALVEVKVRVDTSRMILASAYLPLIDLTIENVLQNKFLEAVDPVWLQEELDREVARAAEVGASRPAEIEAIQSEADRLHSEIELAKQGDEEQGDRAARNLQELKARIDRLGAETELERLSTRIDQELQWARQIVAQSAGDDFRQRLSQLEAEAKTAVASRQLPRMQKVAEDLDRLYWAVATTLPSFWVDQFIQLQEVMVRSSQAAQAAPILREGRAALDRQDVDGLREVCIRLWRLLPEKERSASGLRDIGIRF